MTTGNLQYHSLPINCKIQWQVVNTTLRQEFIDGVFDSFTAAMVQYETIEHGRIEYILTRIVEKK